MTITMQIYSKCLDAVIMSVWINLKEKVTKQESEEENGNLIFKYFFFSFYCCLQN